ncbi:MAG: DNA damage-inducible protein D [Candidatus Binataceae bacterium]
MGSVNYGDFTKSLDDVREQAPNGQTFWMGRKLQSVLNYARWENFEALIEKATVACANSGVDPDGQFRRTTKLITHGKGGQREINDWYLSRYACYLIAMNGNPQVEEVAYAQQYFAVETRLREQENQQISKYDRVAHRRRVTATVKALSSAAKKSGVQRYGLFYDAGYRGLYGGLGLSAIKAKKGIDQKEELLDRAGRVELAAIELKNATTEEQLISLRVQTEQHAMDTHHRVGQEIRTAIRKIGGKMPEDLAPEESIKKMEAAGNQKRLPPTP